MIVAHINLQDCFTKHSFPVKLSYHKKIVVLYFYLFVMGIDHLDITSLHKLRI